MTESVREAAAGATSADVRGGGRLAHALAGLWVIIALLALVPGLPYYLTPVDRRAFAPAAGLFAPTGVVGHSYGIVGTVLILVGVVLYSLRKRSARLSRLGRLRGWLSFHIFLCTLGPFLVLLHTSFKFGGLVAIAFWSMAAVVASGVFGRYVYVRIPRTLGGRAQVLRALRERERELGAQMSGVGVPAETMGMLLTRTGGSGPAPEGQVGGVAAIADTLRFDLGRRGRRRRGEQALARAGVDPAARSRLLAIAEDRARTEQQIRLLEPLQRLFRHWHVFHLPLALVMLLILAVHVAVAVYFGYGWPF